MDSYSLLFLTHIFLSNHIFMTRDKKKSWDKKVPSWHIYYTRLPFKGYTVSVTVTNTFILQSLPKVIPEHLLDIGFLILCVAFLEFVMHAVYHKLWPEKINFRIKKCVSQQNNNRHYRHNLIIHQFYFILFILF